MTSSYLLFFSASFICGNIPQIWRTAVVVPVFKKGVSSNVDNYRPISLTCCCCKVMESIIKDHMLSFLLQQNLISKQQHGFLARKSTCTQLIECTNDWTLALNVRNPVDCIYIDFSKAFDSVVHDKLCSKLSSFGFSDKLLSWIHAFLHSRTFRVRFGSCLSELCNVLSGVPQGSVLGPLLFLLFVNDLEQLFDTKITVKLFADDVKMYIIVNDISDSVTLQKGLDNLVNWSEKWQLKISVPKCQTLHLGRGNMGISYNIGNVDLPNVCVVKDLGITIDSRLDYSDHINTIVTKAHQRACLILRCFKSKEPRLLFRAFTTYVRPLLEYDSPVWSPRYAYLINKLESVQRRFTKRLRGFRQISYADRLVHLNAETLELRRLKSDLTMIFCVIRGFVSIDCDRLFSIIDSETSHTRGHSFKVLKEHCNINCRLYSFVCRNVNVWNSLPDHVVNSDSVAIFKRRLSSLNLSSS